MTADLLVICVTRGRPKSVPALWDAWTATADGRPDLLFAVDDDDPALDGYLACHPAARKAPMDAGYAEVNSPARTAADQAAYRQYRDGGGLESDAAKLRALAAEGVPA